MTSSRLPRDLHPVAWWVWALGLATAASFTTNPLMLLTIDGVAVLVVMARRPEQPWADAFKVYVMVAVVIVVMRVLFRVLLGGGADGGLVLVDLPEVPLPDWVLGLHLLGPVTRESLLAGLYDGLRLGTIVVCVGAANALANPKRLLRSVPAALHEVGTALVVAVTILPLLVESARRVRSAQALRAGDTRRTQRLRRYLVPVLEDSLERSLRLAAGMDTRGYGRSGGVPLAERRLTGALMLLGLCGVCVGVYAGLDHTAPRVLATPMLLLGVAAAVSGLVLAGRRIDRTRYRPDPWRLAGVRGDAVRHRHRDCRLVGGRATSSSSPTRGLATFPEVTPVALVGVLLGLVPAVAARPSHGWPRHEPARAARHLVRRTTTRPSSPASTWPSRRASWCSSPVRPGRASRPCSGS